MNPDNPFKWRHFQADVILLCVRWYLRYPISYRDLEEMMIDRGLKVDHTTLNRWVIRYSPQINQRSRPFLKLTNDSWRVDETYVKVKGSWKYLYRAVDSQGNTLDFLLSAKRDAKAARRFFIKVLNAQHTVTPRVINVDQNAAYPPAVDDLQQQEVIAKDTKLRQVKYLNNLIEQDHRGIKRLTKPGMGFYSFHTARRTLAGFEIMNMIRKGQIHDVNRGDVVAQRDFFAQLFEIAA